MPAGRVQAIDKDRFSWLRGAICGKQDELKRVSGRSLSALVLLVEPEPANPFSEMRVSRLDQRAGTYDQ